jgi:hypothetical protein
MDMAIKTNFIELWNRYFGGSEIPISFITMATEMLRNGCRFRQRICA